MAILKFMLIVALVGYGGLVALVYFGQRSLMYFPETARTPPAAAGLPQAEELRLETSDGESVLVWHVLPRGGKPVVVYFQGNGGALRHRATRFHALVSDGIGLVAPSYRGYGGSTGRPSEAGLLNDAAAAYQFAAAHYPAESLVLWGESLGTGVAAALASQHPIGRLVLESPFTSAVDVGAAVYPFLPVRLLMKDRFRSDQRIGGVSAPVLVLHGARDDVVPIAFGERLFALVKSSKKFVRFPEGSHGDLDAHGALDAVRDFLAGRPE